METSVINTDLDVTSHAHPSPVRPFPQEQRFRAAVARVPLAVYLQDLSFGRSVTVSDVVTPKVRRAPFDKDVNPNHLDVTECWKGLSHTQAVELTMWYQILHQCLHNEVREALSKDTVKELLKSQEAIDDVSLIARMLECLRSKPQRIIEISFVDVIDSMMGMFHDQFPDDSALLASNWSHFSGGLSLFLHNFLRLQDCFGHSARGPYLEVKFDFQYTDWLLMATGDVKWHSPTIRFLHVPATRATGELYRITPFVWKEAYSPVRSQGCDDYVDQVDYTIPRSSLTFHWDPAKGCFIAVVPHFSDVEPHTVETLVTATVTIPFPDYVKFELQSRWSIKLDVMPGKSDFILEIRSSTQNHGIGRFEPPTWSHLSTWTALIDARNRLIPNSRQATVLRHSLGNAVRPQNSHKRKMLKPEVDDAVAGPKRRRCDSMFEIDYEPPSKDASSHDIRYERSCAEEVQRMTERAKNDPCVGSAGAKASHRDADQRHMMSLDIPAPVWTEHLDQCDSGCSSSSRSPAISRESTPPSDNTVVTDRGALHQEEILHNYHEFTDRKLFRDAGLISPVSDGERRVYESIFLGDSDEWSPVTDESAMNLDTIMSDNQRRG